MNDSLHHKLIIIGSGPAGLSAALYAARAELKPLLLTGMVLHGQVSLTHTIENYPGHPEGIGGDALGILFQQQAERFGTIVEYDQATKVDLLKKPFVVSTYSKSFTTDAVIISTGADPKHLNVEGEIDFTGRGVSYCATCDGWFFKDKVVAIVGGGDSSLEEALFLTRYAKSVTIIHRRNELRAGKILENRALTNPRISFIWDTIVTGIYGETGVDHVLTKNTKTGEVKQIPFDGVFIFIGHTPNTELFKDQVSLDEHGYIIVDQKMRTNIPGVFAAGEVADPHYRQVVTSAGMGAAAGIEAVRFLSEM